MPSQFITLLNNLNAGTAPPAPGVHPAEPAFRIQKFSFQPFILVTPGPTVYSGTGMQSKVGSVLQPVVTNPADFDLAFTEIVDLAISKQHLATYSIMGFLSQGNKLITPHDAVSRAESHGGGARGNRGGLGGGGGNLPPTPGNLKNGLWHHIGSGTEFFINDATYHSGVAADPNNPSAGVEDAPILA